MVHTPRQNKIKQEAKQHPHPWITNVKYRVEKKLNENIFSFKVIGKKESQ